MFWLCGLTGCHCAIDLDLKADEVSFRSGINGKTVPVANLLFEPVRHHAPIDDDTQTLPLRLIRIAPDPQIEDQILAWRDWHVEPAGPAGSRPDRALRTTNSVPSMKTMPDQRLTNRKDSQAILARRLQ